MEPEVVARHAEMFANRVKKNHRKLAKGFEREGVGAFRLYDWDIPEVRAVCDWYEGHLVVAEYERTQTEGVDDYAGDLGRAAAAALGLPEERVHAKQRRTRPQEGARYQKLGDGGRLMQVRERALRFWVNLDDFVDTGLFPDHRDTRRRFGEMAAGKRVLNLFSYTGAFTCWAAHGGAKETVSVDRSARYSAWAEDNLALNGLAGPAHAVVAADVHDWLAGAARTDERFDLVLVDPPSFSTTFGAGDFEIQRDHPTLLSTLARRLTADGVLLFSTNHQRFEPRLEGLPFSEIEEITARTVPADYRNRAVHRAFLLRP
ncbi:MAG: class I SAM-dependent methyltransferase [Myxococcota bacterium]|nr:class I SAM-dependent methyltransferase [Myxococcota bacterium]